MAQALIAKATADDTKEPSGFVLKELAQITWNSERECAELFEMLMKRLDGSNATVKYKTLRTIKHIVINGRPEFRTELQRGNMLIKNCLHYNGPMDPVKGDALNQRVRDEAKETMNAIFGGNAGAAERASDHGRYGRSEYPTTSSYSNTYGNSASTYSDRGGGGGGSSGYSSGAASYGGSGYGGGGSQYESRASYDNQSSSNMPDYQGTYSPGTQGSGGGGGGDDDRYGGFGSDGTSGKKKSSRSSGGDQGYNTYKQNTDTYDPGFTTSQNYGSGGGRGSGQVGGGWGNESVTSPSSYGAPGGFSNTVATVPGSGLSAWSAPASGVGSSGRRPMSKSNGEYEGRLVDNITAPTGVRPLPTKDELAKFLTQCESLDKYMIAGLLNAKLADGYPFATQMKALATMEALLEKGNEDVEDYVCENLDALEGFEEGTNTQLKNKAIRILELCGLRESEKPVAQVAAPSASVQYVPARKPDDMFGGLSIASGAPAPTAAAPLPPQPRHAAPIAQPAPLPPAQPQRPAQPSFDIMGNGQAQQAHPPAPAPAVQQTTDLFGQLAISEPAKPAPPAQSSSAGFDIFGSPPPAQQQQQQQQHQHQHQQQQHQQHHQQQQQQAAQSQDPLGAFLNSTSNVPAGPKVDPLTALMSNAKTSIPPARGGPPLGGPQYGAPSPYGQPQGYGYPPQQQYGQPQFGGPPQGYGGYGAPQQPYGGYGAPPQAASPFPGLGGLGPTSQPRPSAAEMNFTVSKAQPFQPQQQQQPRSTIPANFGAPNSGFGFMGADDHSHQQQQNKDKFDFVGDMLKK